MPATINRITMKESKKIEANSLLLSVVIPCYNEEEVISETIKCLLDFCSQLHDLNAELIFIDDGSEDRTLLLLKEYAKLHSVIKIVVFARNFGHQIAVTAGIDASHGDAVVIIDADLQDPPEIIHRMIEKGRDGFDVVYGTRTERIGESAFKRTTARGFYRLINK
jgi:dolichol-phosphate mannosyltransferase